MLICQRVLNCVLHFNSGQVRNEQLALRLAQLISKLRDFCCGEDIVRRNHFPETKHLHLANRFEGALVLRPIVQALFSSPVLPEPLASLRLRLASEGHAITVAPMRLLCLLESARRTTLELATSFHAYSPHCREQSKQCLMAWSQLMDAKECLLPNAGPVLKLPTGSPSPHRPNNQPFFSAMLEDLQEALALSVTFPFFGEAGKAAAFAGILDRASAIHSQLGLDLISPLPPRLAALRQALLALHSRFNPEVNRPGTGERLGGSLPG